MARWFALMFSTLKVAIWSSFFAPSACNCYLWHWAVAVSPTSGVDEWGGRSAALVLGGGQR